MKISRNWLQTFFESPLPGAADLAHALTFHAFEIDGIETHNENDVLDVKVTPNRGHDCLSHRGIAKELAAILQIPCKDMPHSGSEIDLSKRTDVVTVRVEDSGLCPRYMAAYVSGIEVKESPAWLRELLESIGQRSINNIVDATNYVMFTTGQPLHAFDAETLRTGENAFTVSVRHAARGENLVALDEKQYSLTSDMLVIAGGQSDAVLGIAGVKGGKDSGVSASTTSLIIEAANFDGVSVRKTSRTLNLRTDASQRFEQRISPSLAEDGMRSCIQTIKEIAGGELVGVIDVQAQEPSSVTVSVTSTKTSRVLGEIITEATTESIFTRYGFDFKKDADTFTVTPPRERLDLEIEEDLIEEIGRLYGYEHIEPKDLPELGMQPAINQHFYWSEKLREQFIREGFSEVYTSVFAEDGEQAVSNKIGGEKPYLRATLIDGLVDAFTRNKQNKELLGPDEIKLFEIGTVWKNGTEILMVGTISEKEKPAEKSLEEYITGTPDSYESVTVPTANRFQQFSRYPYIVRDIALWVPTGTTPESVHSLIRDHAGDLLVRSYQFDQFVKGERTSYAFRLVFQSFDRTLMDDDANLRMKSVYAAVQDAGYEVR